MITNSSYAKVICLLSTVAGAPLLAGCAGSPDESTASASSSLGADGPRIAPKLPSETLAVPAGNEQDFFFDAIGVQIYACQASATGYSWVFQAPEATLFNRHGRVAGKHYVGPTWESTDGSKVVGAKIAAFTVDPTSIPWLLLKAVSHTGEGRMSEITYIQRLETTGGTAPVTGCDATHVGTVARVDYTATYFFWEASKDD